MPIAFGPERWKTVKENHRKWWQGKLGRPLLHFTLNGRAPLRPAPKLPAEAGEKEVSYDLSVTPEEIVDRWDYNLARREFLGDSFPQVWPNFGPGVLAAFLGAKPAPAQGTVWFHAEQEREAKDLHFALEPANKWLGRVEDVCRAALARWDGLVQVGMTDLGGNLDILSTCRQLGNAFYHLDGVGQLPHLDSLLSIRELQGVQWVPGAGKPQGESWPEVYRKIIGAGKRAQFIGNWRDFDRAVDQVGSAENFILFAEETPDKRGEVEKFLKKYGAM